MQQEKPTPLVKKLFSCVITQVFNQVSRSAKHQLILLFIRCKSDVYLTVCFGGLLSRNSIMLTLHMYLIFSELQPKLWDT